MFINKVKIVEKGKRLGGGGGKRERGEERLIHHKLRNKEKDVVATPVNPPAAPQGNFAYLLSLAGRNCLRY